MADTNQKAVVMDNGTGYLKVGFGGANFPTAVFPTTLGRPLLRSGAKSKLDGRPVKDLMLGDETTGLSHLLEMTYPVSNGVIQDMDQMTLLWDYAFHTRLALPDAGKGRRVMYSEPTIFSNRQRSAVYEVLFEKYGFEAIQTTPQGVLSLLSAGLDTGVAVDCGEGVTHCTPIFEGYAISKANRRVDLGGRNITEFLVRLLQRRGYHFNRTNDFEVVRSIKEMFCYAASDIDLEKKLALETTVLEKAMTLPDNTTIKIGQERFEATEALFNPHLIDVECDGLSRQLWNSIQACDIDLRSRLYQSIVLSGGSTMFPGMSSRVEKDMKDMFLQVSLKGDRSRLKKFNIKIEDPPRRKYMVFLGAAAVAEISAESPESWMPKSEWTEGGASALRARFGGI